MSAHPEEFTPPPAAGATGDTMEAYARVWRRMQAGVERHASSVANDRDEREELMQAARVKLWQLDASRCDVSNAEDVAYLRRALKNEMNRVSAANFAGRAGRGDLVPSDLARALRGLNRDSAAE